MRSRIRARFASSRYARSCAVHPRPYPRCLADQLRSYDITVNCIAPASSQSDHGMVSCSDTLPSVAQSLNSPPLRQSDFRAVPGQSRRRAVRSGLDPLSRGPVHPERKLALSGTSILWLRYKNEWRSRQYYEGLREGFPSAPEVGLPLDTGNLRERSFRSSKQWGWSGLDQADCRFCMTRIA